MFDETAIQLLASLLGDLLGELDAQTAMIKLIARKVGVTPDELRAEAERMRQRKVSREAKEAGT